MDKSNLSKDTGSLVSIIMNCRNSEKYLREAIDSIYSQTYKNWEIIFLDNASTDGSADIAKSYDRRLRYFKSGRALTLGKARNLAMAEARGQYLAFLDCDDKWLPRKLEREVSLLEARRDIDFVYTNYFRLIMPRADNLILGLKGKQPQGDVFSRFLYSYPVNQQTVMLRMEVINKLNAKFDDHIELSEELDFFMKILFRYHALYIDEPLVISRVHENMNSLRLLHKYPIEMEYIMEKFKKMDSSFERTYAPAIRYFEGKIGYWYARAEMERNNPGLARSKLAPHKFVDIKFFILYILTYFPPAVWKHAHRYKLEGRFRWIG